MILPMKKATIFALRSDRDALLLALQRSSVIMVTENDGSVCDERADITAGNVQSTREALSFMGRYREKASFFSSAPSVDFDDLVCEKQEGAKLAARVAEIENEMAALNSEISADESALSQFEPWLGMDIKLSELCDTKTSRVHTGFIPQGNAARFKELENDGAHVELFGFASGSLAALFVCHKSQDEELSESTKSLGFVESAPPFAPGTPKQEHDRIVLEIAAANTALAALRDEAKETGAKVSSLELLYDKLNSDLAREQTPYSQTDRTFYIVGWVLAEREDELSEIINEATAIYDLVLEDPPEGEEPPTMTRNNKFVTPFETLTDMFSRPNPADGIDPNPAMAPWYWIIFGMMMADAGYGVMMAILFTLFRKFKKPRGEFGKLITVLQFASVTTTFWGVMFGSYFGAEWLPPVLFTPLYSPMSMMIMCFVLGAAHISCGLIIKAIELIKHGEWQLALGQCFGWIIVFLGIGMLAVPLTSGFAKWIAIGGVVLIILFSKSGAKNIFARFGGGIFSLYDITGYMSDILSYSRILALMLSSGVVAMVMNLLAGMVQGSVIGFFFSILIYIVGHVFNLAMGLLSAYVHASRLQYIEFFGKFYDGGGYAFRPLAPDTRYTVVKTEQP